MCRVIRWYDESEMKMMKNYFSFLFANYFRKYFRGYLPRSCTSWEWRRKDFTIDFSKKKKKFYQSFIKKKKKKPSRRGNFLRNLEGEEIGWKSWRARLSLYIEGLLFSVLVGILFNSKAKTRLPTWIPFATSPFGEGGEKKREKNQCCDSRRVSWRNSLSRRAALFSLSSL